MRYDNEIRVGANVKQLVHRALQFAYSDPKGPVYLMAAREVMEQQITRVEAGSRAVAAHVTGCLANGGCSARGAAPGRESSTTHRHVLCRAQPRAVAFVRLCPRIGAGVLESVPNYCNFPFDDPLYQGTSGSTAPAPRAR